MKPVEPQKLPAVAEDLDEQVAREVELVKHNTIETRQTGAETTNKDLLLTITSPAHANIDHNEAVLAATMSPGDQLADLPSRNIQTLPVKHADSLEAQNLNTMDQSHHVELYTAQQIAKDLKGVYEVFRTQNKTSCI